MTDAEIIKALETCIGPEAVKLYICNIESEISIITVAEITDLIKRQQAEIEILESHSGKCIYLSDDSITHYCVEAICPKFKTEKQIKDEAVKEFAERFLKKVHDNHYVLKDAINSTDYGMFTAGIEQAVNETKKEMVGE